MDKTTNSVSFKVSFFLLLTQLVVAGCSSKTSSTPPDSGTPLPDITVTDAGNVDSITVKVVKGFTCDPKAVTGVTTIAEIDGLKGATLAIRPTSTACQFDLLYRSGGKSDVLSSEPGGYLLAVGRVTSQGDVVICASNIDHGGVGSGKVHRIRAVPLQCAVKRGSSWSALTAVVEGKEKWAAWIDDVQVSSADTSAFEVTYRRDFSFQFLNLANKGRPSTDGVYKTTFRLGQGDALTADKTTKSSGSIWDPKTVNQQGWEPTSAELKELAPYIKKDEGKCPPPNGCPAP